MNEREIELLKQTLETNEFEVDNVDFRFDCDSMVIAKYGTNSLCYTTSRGRSELIVSILNEWKKLRKEKKSR